MSQLDEDTKLVQRIDRREDGRLRPGEADVVDGWLKQLEEGRPLSAKQRKWAEDIDDRSD